ncbi:MAG: sigma-70 family RNA polymerase sigma factor [Planctomycetota bacterium]
MNSHDSTSASLLVRLRDTHDRDAWSRFVELYTPLIYYWARKTGLQPQDASDLVQDVLATMVTKLPSFQYDESRSFRGWLRTVTMNKWRERNRRASLPMVAASTTQIASLVQPDAAESFWDHEYREQLVARCMELMKDQFQPTTWQACQKYVLSECSAEEIAEEFGISVWTIYSAKSRLLKKLREHLDGLLD